uniref:Uncharacterized protein n=1 Tax=Tanacetum cinerariifolium TaxID=118510 RepID=A0A6L2MVZ2_TANCI|nr:hypothetical protein [Tanacetum cinerariifolium]
MLEIEREARLNLSRKRVEEHWKEVAALRKLKEEYDYEHDPEYDSGDDSFECLDYDELHLARLAEKSLKWPQEKKKTTRTIVQPDTQAPNTLPSSTGFTVLKVNRTRSFSLSPNSQYTSINWIHKFHDTLIQLMESVKESIDERAHHKREYDSWVNEKQTPTTEEKVDTSKALDASFVATESSGTKSKERDTSIRSGMDAHTDDADIRPIYDEDPMAEIQTTSKINVFATGQQHTEQPEFNNEGKVDQNTVQCHDTCPFPAKKKGFAIAALKNELRKLTGNSVNTKFAKSSILGKPVLQPHRNQSVIRQPNAFKSEWPRISKPRFASQLDVNNDLSKPVTTHYLPKEREATSTKPHHVIASSNSRNGSKNMPRFSSNDMVHNHYLEEAKHKTHGKGRNSKPSVMHYTRSQSTTNGSKPKLGSITTSLGIGLHLRKCVFNANHDHCVTKFLNEVNSHAKVPSNKTTNRNKPVEQTSFVKKPERQILKGHRFSIKKTSVMHEKTMNPRSCLKWKPTGKIFKTVGLRWVPTEKIFTSSITKVDSEPTNGSDEDITNQYEYEQTLDVSAGTLNLSAGTSFNPIKEGLRVWFMKRLISQKPRL